MRKQERNSSAYYCKEQHDNWTFKIIEPINTVQYTENAAKYYFESLA